MRSSKFENLTQFTTLKLLIFSKSVVYPAYSTVKTEMCRLKNVGLFSTHNNIKIMSFFNIAGKVRQ